MSKSVLLVIPAHNRKDELAELLSSLNILERTGLNLKVAVVDDASTPALRGELEGRFGNLQISFLRNESAQGPARCRNMAARDFNGDYLWFLDSDSEIIRPGVMVNMVRRLQADAALAGTGGAIGDVRGGRRILETHILKNFLFVCRAFPLEGYRPAYVRTIGTNNLMLKHSIFQQAGGFAEDLLRDEDNDLCLTVGRKGYRFYQDEDTLALHKFSDSGREGGAFKHFESARHYLKDMLDTRTDIILKHRPRLLLVLPLLDLLLVPWALYQTAKGRLAVRITKVAGKKQESRLRWCWLCLLQALKCYWRGMVLVIRNW